MIRPNLPLLGLALLAATAPALEAASFSPDGQWLAFSYIGGPENLYLVRPDGSDEHDLLVRAGRDFRPEWAPDGSHLVFTAVKDDAHVIMRIDADGANLRALTRPGDAAGDPHYSPDGRQLLYFTDEPLPRDLHVLDVASGTVTRLTDTPDFSEMSARFGPHGKRVVFVGRAAGEGAESDIWMLELESGERRNLTQTAQAGEFHPTFSHDGRAVAYVTVREGTFAVALRELDSGEERIVAAGNGYAVLDPHFAPDDASITFTRTDFAEQGPGMPAIVRVNLADGVERRIAKGRYLSETAED